jgi:protoporphyrin/coproporphyrin ferrochelatase
VSLEGRLGVLVVNFGEPEEATPRRVVPYLERIFLQNVDLESHTADAAVARARELAAARAPGLIEDYRAIGGSPLNAQANRQAEALERELHGRGWTATTYSVFQFVEPLVEEGVRRAREDGVERLVVLPVYPICGQSTTVAALRRTRQAVEALGWRPEVRGLSGWHHHPSYAELRADGIRDFVRDRGLDLDDPDTILHFSVHGTPIKYLDEGNRYDRYVEEHTREIARRLGVEDRYSVGFQNHTNRDILWTQPDNEDCIAALRERRLVIVPIAFMHEQSETLAELDVDLRDHVEGEGREYHRVPVPHDDDRFVRLLADLVTALVGPDPSAGGVLAQCRCALPPGIWCTNGARDLPPSPYVPKAS